MHTIGKPAADNPWNSHGVDDPVSSPTSESDPLQRPGVAAGTATFACEGRPEWAPAGQAVTRMKFGRVRISSAQYHTPGQTTVRSDPTTHRCVVSWLTSSPT